jgi:hypothetical protein
LLLRRCAASSSRGHCRPAENGIQPTALYWPILDVIAPTIFPKKKGYKKRENFKY